MNPASCPKRPGRLVGCVVVQHDVNCRPFWMLVLHHTVDSAEKAEEFVLAVASVATANHFTCLDIQGGKEGCRSMALIVMGPGVPASLAASARAAASDRVLAPATSHPRTAQLLGPVD